MFSLFIDSLIDISGSFVSSLFWKNTLISEIRFPVRYIQKSPYSLERICAVFQIPRLMNMIVKSAAQPFQGQK